MPSKPEENETMRDWETIQEDAGVSKLDRLKISGGWLYRTVVTGYGVAMVFVPE